MARRRLLRNLTRATRRARHMCRAGLAIVGLALPLPLWACADWPVSDQFPFRQASFVALPGCERPGECQEHGIGAAWFAAPTDRYAHGVLGDAIEAGSLQVFTSSDGADACRVKTLDLDANHVFEDIAPRLIDVDLDGRVEVVAVRSHKRLGAQLTIWTDPGHGPTLQLLAATPYIGRSNRWLAPLGGTDLDGDRYVELAYIDRPHLAKTLRVWRFQQGNLHLVASLEGLTNHKIGQDFISGGIRTCATGTEMITADANWTNVIATRLENDQLISRTLAPFQGSESLRSALLCP